MRIENGKRRVNREEIEIHILSIGKADCILVQMGDEAMLIDAGWKETEQDVIQYLNDEGITELKYAIATHAHKDHIGGMEKVLKEIRVKNLLVSPIGVNNDLYKSMMNRANKRGTTVIVPKVLDSYELGEAKITILAPGEEALKKAEETEKLNHSSLVLRLDFYERSFLFMSDALHSSEQEMIENQYRLQADVIKIAHHGNTDASSGTFIDKVSPKTAVITCNEEDADTHTIVSEMLEDKGIAVYCTGEDGIIVLTSDGIDVKIKLQNDSK